MKKNIFILTLLFITVLSNAQEENPDADKDNLSHKSVIGF
jgi:hypothetical protein